MMIKYKTMKNPKQPTIEEMKQKKIRNYDTKTKNTLD